VNGWLLALGAALAYLPSLAAVFQFDDFNVIVHDRAVHSWPAYLEGATGVRALLKASYTLSWTLGLGAAGFELFNIAVHVLNTVLVYQVGRSLSGRWDISRAHGAFLAALLFALHPVQVEAVTYISGRSASLMAAFYLGAVLAYLRGTHWAVPAVLFVLAAATKETALTLPAALLLCELAGNARPDWKAIARRQAPYWLLLGALLAVLFFSPRYSELIGFGFTRRGIADNLLTQVGGVSYLVARLLGLLGPNIDPALPVLQSWTEALLLQAVLLGVLLASGITQLRRRPWLGFGLLWFFLHLAPTNSFVPRLDVANDRQLYLAGWGLFLAAAVMVPRRLAMPAALLATLLAIGSTTRQLDYRSEVALWESDLRRAPWNARAYNNLGYAYQKAGRIIEARRAYEAALLFDPGHQKARFNLLLSR
jgi:tetratricopeptide (TPR) repeat protein